MNGIWEHDDEQLHVVFSSKILVLRSYSAVGLKTVDCFFVYR